jgi:hypothetical protein
MMSLEIPGIGNAPVVPSVINISGDVKKTSEPLRVTLSSEPSSSLLAKDLRRIVPIDRAHLLIRGKYDELLRSLNIDEKRFVLTKVISHGVLLMRGQSNVYMVPSILALLI